MERDGPRDRDIHVTCRAGRFQQELIYIYSNKRIPDKKVARGSIGTNALSASSCSPLA